MRAFVAIEFDSLVKEAIFQSGQLFFSSPLKISWVKKDNLHLTLKFLGEVEKKIKLPAKGKEEERLLIFKEVLEKVSKEFSPFSLTFSHFGFFSREPLILWLGVNFSPSLFSLVARLEEEFENLGFPKERRRFFPHITLGRGKNWRGEKRRLEEILAEKKTPSLPAFLVSQISLMESRLSPFGAIYRPIFQVYLSEKKIYNKKE